MSTATNDNNPRKRVRISETVTTSNENSTSQQQRTDYNLYTGALLSLQPAIRRVADVFFKKLTDIYKTVTSNRDKLKKFSDNDDFIPKSCRLNFCVGASNYIKGSQEFMELQTKIENDNKQVAIKHRDFVVDVIKLEIKATTDALQKTFCECLFKLARIFLQSSYFEADIPDDDAHALATSIIMSHPAILKYIFKDNANRFKIYYHKLYNITAPAQPQAEVITEILPNGSRNINDYNPTEGDLASYEYAEASEPGTGLDIILANRRLRATIAPPNNNVVTYTLTDIFREQFKTLMFRMVNQSWTSMINLHYTKLIDAKLSQMAESLITSDVTNDVAMIVAAQPPASEAIINDIINAKFNELKRTLTTITRNEQVPSKNKKRGENVTRASTKKQKTTTPKSNEKTTTPKSKEKQQNTPSAKTKQKGNKKQQANNNTPKRNEAGGSKRATTKDKSATPKQGTNKTTRARTSTKDSKKRQRSTSASNRRRGTSKSRQATNN
jgi:hypothetical protein